MKRTQGGENLSGALIRTLAGIFIIAAILAGLEPHPARAMVGPMPGGGGGSGPAYVPLQSFSFYDTTNWTDDAGYAPVSFSNLNFSWLGNGRSLVVATNLPAWLQYNVWENDGTTNLTVDSGSVTFWFASSSWSSTKSNMSGLDKSVNRSLGTKIQNQIKDLPEGTKVNNVKIKDP
jgi:hypothetical protein